MDSEQDTQRPAPKNKGGRPRGSKEGQKYFNTVGYDLFDYGRFMEDIYELAFRQGASLDSLGREHKLSLALIRPAHQKRGSRLAFRTVCFLASYFDVNLNDYITDVLYMDDDPGPGPFP